MNDWTCGVKESKKGEITTFLIQELRGTGISLRETEPRKGSAWDMCVLCVCVCVDG